MSTSEAPSEGVALAMAMAADVAPSDSEAESISLCGSELEAELAWGEGPIAPLRYGDAQNALYDAEGGDGAVVRSTSNGGGAVRAKTPQKRADPSPLKRSKRLINVHPLRSPAYLAKPNELPLGVRKQQRWFNDHHFGNRAASTRLEDLMEHMTINVEWRSNFQKLAEPENEQLQTAFRKGRIQPSGVPNQSKHHRKDDWNAAEEMFARIDRRARTLVVRSFRSLRPFIEAVEQLVLHFMLWREVPSDVEVAPALSRMLVHPMEVMAVSKHDVRLCIPLMDSAFHRLIVHSVCQFYGVRSRTEANRQFQTKIMVLKCGSKSKSKSKLSTDDAAAVSFCEFVRATRFGSSSLASPDAFEESTKMSECSDGYCMIPSTSEVALEA